MQVAAMHPAAAHFVGRSGEADAERYLGEIDGELQMEMGKGVLDQSRHLAPIGLEWRMIEVQLSPVAFAPRR